MVKPGPSERNGGFPRLFIRVYRGDKEGIPCAGTGPPAPATPRRDGTRGVRSIATYKAVLACVPGANGLVTVQKARGFSRPRRRLKPSAPRRIAGRTTPQAWAASSASPTGASLAACTDRPGAWASFGGAWIWPVAAEMQRFAHIHQHPTPTWRMPATKGRGIEILRKEGRQSKLTYRRCVRRLSWCISSSFSE
ncbi:hypothetical protein LZ30DRAFT_735191 [Colletotrichum cereale]|nr:hypothetical protein LZ30DRAFT_735191 [Colletotrichum cereale]